MKNPAARAAYLAKKRREESKYRYPGKDLQFWPYTPTGDRQAFERLLAEAERRWPGRQLSFIGHAEGTAYFQEWGNTDSAFEVDISEALTSTEVRPSIKLAFYITLSADVTSEQVEDLERALYAQCEEQFVLSASLRRLS